MPGYRIMQQETMRPTYIFHYQPKYCCQKILISPHLFYDSFQITLCIKIILNIKRIEIKLINLKLYFDLSVMLAIMPKYK